jgi:hypothetical protein
MAPGNNKMTISGMSHHFFSCLVNLKNSLSSDHMRCCEFRICRTAGKRNYGAFFHGLYLREILPRLGVSRVREMVAHESDEHLGKVTAIPANCPTLQICEAAVRLSMMLMTRDTLSLYCGSPVNCFQTGDAENPCQCCLCASRFSPHVM